MSEYGYDADQPGGVEQQSAPEDTTEYTVIIDIGESTTKVGLAGMIRLYFHDRGKRRQKPNARRSGVVKEYIAADAAIMRGVMKIEYRFQERRLQLGDTRNSKSYIFYFLCFPSSIAM